MGMRNWGTGGTGGGNVFGINLIRAHPAAWGRSICGDSLLCCIQVAVLRDHINSHKMQGINSE